MKKLKKKIKFYKGLLIEIIETLRSICIYLEYDSRRSHNPCGQYMSSHFEVLGNYSEVLRLEEREKKQ